MPEHKQDAPLSQCCLQTEEKGRLNAHKQGLIDRVAELQEARKRPGPQVQPPRPALRVTLAGEGAVRRLDLPSGAGGRVQTTPGSPRSRRRLRLQRMGRPRGWSPWQKVCGCHTLSETGVVLFMALGAWPSEPTVEGL